MKLPINYEEAHWTTRKEARLQYIQEQKGLCNHCGENLLLPPEEKIEKTYINRNLFPSKFFEYPIHLHHDRETGMTIGAVHNRCNAYLWQYHGE